MLKKIYIVGSAGSGKTTLANLLCKKFKSPHFDLDDIAYPNQKSRPTVERLKDISNLSSKKEWVAEGVYVSWVKDLLKSADQIIWLDFQLFTTLFRIAKRFIKNKFTGHDPHGFRAFIRLLRGLIHYYYPRSSYETDEMGEYITQEKIRKALEPYKNKVIRIKNDSQLEKFIESLNNRSL